MQHAKNTKLFFRSYDTECLIHFYPKTISMKCSKCGNELPDGSRFCDNCGSPLTPTQEETSRPKGKTRRSASQDGPTTPQDVHTASQGEQVTPNIFLGKDGKYHWYYEFRMLRNPMILFTVFKVLGLSFLIVYLFVVSLTACDGGPRMWSGIWELTYGFAALMAVMLLLGVIAYVIVAAINGWRYCVMFEMDEHGVVHTQMPTQFKRAQAMATVLMLAGAASGNVGRTGQGMMVRGKQSSSSSWSSVREVIISRRHNTIKVNERLNHNQVYAEDADFDFVAKYIKEHVGKKCKISE